MGRFRSPTMFNILLVIGERERANLVVYTNGAIFSIYDGVVIFNSTSQIVNKKRTKKQQQKKKI